MEKALRIKWDYTLFQTASFKSGRRQLFLLMSPARNGYAVMAIETSSPGADDKDDIKSVHSFFDDHAHDVVVTGVTEARAKKAAREYVADWLKKQKKLDKCGCEKIEAENDARQNDSGLEVARRQARTPSKRRAAS